MVGEEVAEMSLRHLAPACFAELRKTFFSDDVGVLPLGKTGLARQFEFSALRRLKTAQLRPTMTGPTKSKERRGIKLPHHWDREFPQSPEGVRIGWISEEQGYVGVLEQ